MSNLGPGAIHVVLPDSQVKPGVPLDHLNWIGQYIVDRFAGHPNTKVIHLGDFADMPSLSSYDKGKKAMEGRRIRADFEAVSEGFAILNAPLEKYNAERKAWKEKQWWPERHIMLGNHEDRITRAVNTDAQLDGVLSLDMLPYADHGWTVHPFLQPVFIDGVGYSHYWINRMSGKPLGGMAATRLKTIGHSFTMGHQQTLDYAVRFVTNATTGVARSHHGLVCGAAYLHDESYLTAQGNAHWRGIIVCHQVEDGSYDPMFVSLNYLSWRYTGKPVSEWMVDVVA